MVKGVVGCTLDCLKSTLFDLAIRSSLNQKFADSLGKVTNYFVSSNFKIYIMKARCNYV